MVKKFTEFINEWVVTRTDDPKFDNPQGNNLNVDKIDFKEFCDYLNKIYEYDDPILKREAGQGGPVKYLNDGICIYLKQFDLFELDENGELMIVALKNEVEANIDICDFLQDIAEIGTYIHKDKGEELEVVTFSPKDGSDVNNRFFIQLVDYIIDNVEDCGIERI